MKQGKIKRRRQRKRSAVTILDVARRAGVSTATVSRALAESGVVSARTRARVMQAVRKTGYMPNVAARNLRARRTMMVLVVVPNLANPFFGEILRGIDDELVAAGYDMIIGNLDNQREREGRYVDIAVSGQVDGVLLLSGRIPAGNGRSMDEIGLPMVTVCAAIEALGGASVVVDDRRAAQAVAEHFVALGHRRFGYVAGPPGNINEIDRRRGFLAGVEKGGFDAGDVVVWPGMYDFQAGVDAARDWVARRSRPTAVFATCDATAISFMKTIIAAGGRVPGDISVVGFDGIEFADLMEPTLTTVQQPRNALGRAAARALLDQLRGERSGAVRIELPTTLRIGGTTGPPPAAARRVRRATGA